MISPVGIGLYRTVQHAPLVTGVLIVGTNALAQPALHVVFTVCVLMVFLGRAHAHVTKIPKKVFGLTWPAMSAPTGILVRTALKLAQL